MRLESIKGPQGPPSHSQGRAKRPPGTLKNHPGYPTGSQTAPQREVTRSFVWFGDEIWSAGEGYRRGIQLLEIRYQPLETGYQLLDTKHWILDTRCWILDTSD